LRYPANPLKVYFNLVPLFADQLNELSGSGLTEILPDLTDYYTNEEE